MKQFKILTLAILLLAACSKDSNEVNPAGPTADGTPTLKSSVSRPIEIIISSAADVNSTNPPTACTGDLPGFAIGDLLLSGTASHLGQLGQSTLHHTGCDLSFATHLLTTTVSGQMAAANGDLIYYSGDDTIDVLNLLTNAGTTGPINGVWNITGGTGRFAGASGTITISGTVDFITSTFTATGTGTVTY